MGNALARLLIKRPRPIVWQRPPLRSRDSSWFSKGGGGGGGGVGGGGGGGGGGWGGGGGGGGVANHELGPPARAAGC